MRQDIRPNLWSKIEALKGQTLRTVRGKEFTVSDIAVGKVTVVPQSTGKPRGIAAREFAAAAAIVGGPKGLTATQVRAAGASEMNPVYVVAILKAIAGEGGSNV